MTQSPSQMTGMTSARLTRYEQNRTSVWPDQPKFRERSAPHPSSSYHGRGGQAKGMHSSSDRYDMVHRVRHGVEYRSRISAVRAVTPWCVYNLHNICGPVPQR